MITIPPDRYEKRFQLLKTTIERIREGKFTMVRNTYVTSYDHHDKNGASVSLACRACAVGALVVSTVPWSYTTVPKSVDQHQSYVELHYYFDSLEISCIEEMFMGIDSDKVGFLSDDPDISDRTPSDIDELRQKDPFQQKLAILARARQQGVEMRKKLEFEKVDTAKYGALRLFLAMLDNKTKIPGLPDLYDG